jgi:hypothetical protein
MQLHFLFILNLLKRLEPLCMVVLYVLSSPVDMASTPASCKLYFEHDTIRQHNLRFIPLLHSELL